MKLKELGVGDGQGGLACCSPWGHKGSDMTEWLNWTEAEFGASLAAQTVKNLPAMQQTQVFPDWYYPEKVNISEDMKKISLFRYRPKKKKGYLGNTTKVSGVNKIGW